MMKYGCSITAEAGVLLRLGGWRRKGSEREILRKKHQSYISRPRSFIALVLCYTPTYCTGKLSSRTIATKVNRLFNHDLAESESEAKLAG